MSAHFQLRPYQESDEDVVIALWQRTWQLAYPAIDFGARVEGWRARWRNELVPIAEIVVAERESTIIGFVTVDATGYLDQLVVDPDSWGSDLGNILIAEAKRMAPERPYVAGQ